MIELRMSEPQGLALLAMVRRGAPPDELDGRNLSAMHRAADRIEAALNRRKPPRFAATLDDLSDALLGVQREPFVDVIHGRLSDLLAVVRLWTAAEGLPKEPRFWGLLQVDLIDSVDWRADVLDALDAAGIEAPR